MALLTKFNTHNRKAKRSTALFLLLFAGLIVYASHQPADDGILSYQVDLKKQDLNMYWKDEHNNIFKSIANLKTWLGTKGQRLIFAMNGGMFNADYSPKGLFIEQQKVITRLDTANGSGNFYLKPNGVFYINTNKTAAICKTADFHDKLGIKYATQSGPMLVAEGEINAAFKPTSTNLNIRNGVGILPDHRVIFAITKKEMNFYDFASFFKKMGCKNALYLDGFVSRCYLPEKNWQQTDGSFGVIIGVATMSK